MTLNQLAMLKVVPREKHGSCVPTAIAFVTNTNYFDVEELIEREQKNFRSEVKNNPGVRTSSFLGNERKLFGHQFTRLPSTMVPERLGNFIGRYSVGTFLVRRHRHVYVVKDGEVFDGRDDSFRHPVLEAWAVRKIL